MRKALSTFAVVVVMLMAGHSALADSSINVGTHYVQQNTITQIPIYVTGTDQVNGMDLKVQIADGGSYWSGDPASDDAPKMTNVDLIVNTIFASNHSAVSDPYASDPSGPQYAYRIISTSDGISTVPANGQIATLTIDTTNVTPGQYTLSLGATFDGSTDFSPGITPSITDGSIVVTVPEPTSLAGIALAGTVLLARRRKPAARVKA